jgi:hypothetical protein
LSPDKIIGQQLAAYQKAIDVRKNIALAGNSAIVTRKESLPINNPPL